MSDFNIKTDPRRAYWGRDQLTQHETGVLTRITGSVVQLSFAKGEVRYWCRGQKVDTRAADRLVKFRYLIPKDPGLLAEGPAQTWVVNPTWHPPENKDAADC